MSPEHPPGALAGVRVVEMGQLMAGPFRGQLLGDMSVGFQNSAKKSPAPELIHGNVRRRPVLGGLINEYETAA